MNQIFKTKLPIEYQVTPLILRILIWFIFVYLAVFLYISAFLKYGSIYGTIGLLISIITTVLSIYYLSKDNVRSYDWFLITIGIFTIYTISNWLEYDNSTHVNHPVPFWTITMHLLVSLVSFSMLFLFKPKPMNPTGITGDTFNAQVSGVSSKPKRILSPLTILEIVLLIIFLKYFALVTLLLIFWNVRPGG